MPFETSIFVNCPFDDDFTPLLKSILFTIIYLEFEPRIALERFDSAESRIHKIVELIRESRYGIHDLSRLKATKKGEFSRLNMPFELGLDIGCRYYGPESFASKKCLILEKERFRYQAALSDLSGSDIKYHEDSAEKISKVVRDWIINVARISKPPSPSAIWAEYLDYNAWLFDKLTAQAYSSNDIDELPINEVMTYMSEYLN